MPKRIHFAGYCIKGAPNRRIFVKSREFRLLLPDEKTKIGVRTILIHRRRPVEFCGDQ
jgi:hypothetical protein